MRNTVHTWLVEFTKPHLKHTEYITGTEKQMKEYVQRVNDNYGTKSSFPLVVSMPKQVRPFEKKVNLTCR